MRGLGYAGTGTFLVLELAGRLEAARLEESLRRAMAAYPETMAAAGLSFWRRWPVWRLPSETVRPRYVCEDLRAADDWVAETDAACQRRFGDGWDPAEPPQVRVEHYVGPGERHRVCLRWAHALMDAEGAQLFLAEMDRLGRDADPTQDSGRDACTPLNRLGGGGVFRRLAYAGRGLRERASGPAVLPQTICPPPAGGMTTSRCLHYLHRVWEPERVEEMRQRASETVPAGRAPYARYVAGCVLRAVYRLQREHGRELSVVGAMLPMRYPELGQRRVLGNFLVAAAVLVPPACVEDRRALAAEIHRQVQGYFDRRSYRASWALQWLTAELRAGQYRRLIARQTREQPFATGLSYYGELDPPLRSLLGAEITNMWGAAVVSVPPGWNPAFSKFAGRINFALAWPGETASEAVARRYADLIEEEVFTAG